MAPFCTALLRCTPLPSPATRLSFLRFNSPGIRYLSSLRRAKPVRPITAKQVDIDGETRDEGNGSVLVRDDGVRDGRIVPMGFIGRRVRHICRTPCRCCLVGRCRMLGWFEACSSKDFVSLPAGLYVCGFKYVIFAFVYNVSSVVACNCWYMDF